jgi:hypothetical protein
VLPDKRIPYPDGHGKGSRLSAAGAKGRSEGRVPEASETDESRDPWQIHHPEVEPAPFDVLAHSGRGPSAARPFSIAAITSRWARRKNSIACSAS